MQTIPNTANGNALKNASQWLDLTLVENSCSTFSFVTMTVSFLLKSCQNSHKMWNGNPLNSLKQNDRVCSDPLLSVSLNEFLNTTSISSANSFLNLRGYKANILEYPAMISRARAFMMDSRMCVASLCLAGTSTVPIPH
jgi:hypothetical protein